MIDWILVDRIQDLLTFPFMVVMVVMMYMVYRRSERWHGE